MHNILVSFALLLAAPLAFAQADRPAFHVLMEHAKIKKLIAVDTIAGKTHMLFTSNTEEPAFVFIF